MKKYLGLLIVLGLVFTANAVKAEDDTEDAVVCTQEVKECPDGTFVGRRGPKCEFALCGDQKEKQEDRGEKIKREEARNLLETKRETLKTDMEKKREELKDAMEAKREEFKKEVKAKKEEFRSANLERKTKFCQAASNLAGQRFDSAVKNLENFQTRLGAVIEKLKESGQDTTLAEVALDLSETTLAGAKEKLADLRKLVPESCDGVTADTFEQVKLLSREIKDLLKEVKTDLQETISAIKDLRVDDDSADDSDDDKAKEN